MMRSSSLSTARKLLVLLLSLCGRHVMVNADGIYTVMFKYVYAQGEDRSCHAYAGCQLHLATAYALSQVEGFETLALSTDWTMENKCPKPRKDELHEVLVRQLEAAYAARLAAMEKLEAERDAAEQAARAAAKAAGISYSTESSESSSSSESSESSDSSEEEEDDRARSLLVFGEDEEQRHRQLGCGTCGKLCKSGAKGWCNCCSCCGSRRRLEEAPSAATGNLRRGLQQVMIHKSYTQNDDKYLEKAAAEAAHHANVQLAMWLGRGPIDCLEYDGPYDEATRTGGYNIEVQIVKEADDDGDDFPTMAPTGAPTDFTAA